MEIERQSKFINLFAIEKTAATSQLSKCRYREKRNATNGCQIEKLNWWSATIRNDILKLSSRQKQLRRNENDSS